MKKLIVFAGILLYCSQAFAGGLLTNGNQSAQYIRMLSRNASISPDAVYFNPAGLMLMDNGFYISVQSQSLFQTKSVQSGFPLLNTGKFDGTLTAPIFPTAYAVYKRDKVAFSLGFGPNSGGGSADFGKGLPSFEKEISTLPYNLSDLSKLGLNVKGYSADLSFNGKSVYWGIQGGVSVKVNEIFSVYGGLRYVPATNKYTGYVKNISVGVNGTFKNAATFLGTDVTGVLKGLAGQSSAAAAGVQPLISGGAGSYTLATIQGAGYMSAADRAKIEQGLMQIAGLTQNQIDHMNVTQIQGAFVAGATMLNGQAAVMTATAAQLLDKNVDVTQTGAGITPIIGIDIKPTKNLNIGIKYEFMTSLTLTNKTKVDGTGLFPDKKQTGSDVPAVFSIGVDYKVSKFTFSGSFNHYNDKGVDWGMNIYDEPRVIDHNTWEFALGTQYQLTKMVAISCGYLRTNMGVYPQFQSDFSYYNNTANTFGGGFEFKLTPKFTVDAGVLYTKYKDATKDFQPKMYNAYSAAAYSETYSKHNLGFAIGLGYHFGGL
ncbi:MAG: hypothetical protein WCJ95_19785 [Mariniphaga sp.]